MARYYFDLVVGNRVEADLFGDELPDLDAVRKEAILYTLERVPDALQRSPTSSDFQVNVRDDGGLEVLSVTLRVKVRHDVPI